MLTQLIYRSVATLPFLCGDFVRLLEPTRQNNERKAISGLLLYHQGVFMQVLEGEPNAVGDVIERIRKDKRHRALEVLRNQEIAKRDFGRWSMGFLAVDELDAEMQPLEQVFDTGVDPGALDLTRIIADLNRLKPFIEL